jgi:hypothetical protein
VSNGNEGIGLQRPPVKTTAGEADALLSITASDRRAALDGTRTAVAEWLEVEPDAFDVEVR